MATLTQGDLKDKVLILRTASPAEFRFTDETPWGTGVLPTLAARYRKVRITDPTGTVVYEDNWDGSTSTDINDWNGVNFDSDMDNVQTTFASATVPTNNADGSFVDGNYKFEINTLYDQGAASYLVVQSKTTKDVTFSRPVGKILASVDLNPYSPQLKAIDKTDYVVDGITPTNTRLFEYFPPQGTGLTGNTTSSDTITKSTFASGTSVFQLTNSNIATWDFSSKTNDSETNTYTSGNFTLLLTDKVTAREEFKVQDDVGLCDVICCVIELRERYEKAISNGNPTKANDLEEIWTQVMTRIAYIQASQSCGKTEGLNEVIAEIKDLADCGSDCGCGGGTPSVISPIVDGATTNTSVITFNTSTVSSANFTRKPAGGGGSTYISGDLVGKTYSGTQRDFEVFFDGFRDLRGSFDSTTGTFTFQSILSTDVEVEIAFK